MGWVLLKRTDLKYNEVILVSMDMYLRSGGGRLDWDVIARGSDADYETLLNMAKLTDSFVELSVNREMENRKLYYGKKEKEHNNVS